SGYEFPDGLGAERTFILPADTYAVSLVGTALGTGHVSVFSPGATSERTQVFTFPVARHQRGSMTIGASGASGALRFGHRSYAPAAGMPLTVTAVARYPRASPSPSPSPSTGAGGPRTPTVVIHVRDALGRPVPDAIVTAVQARKIGAQGATDDSGTVQLSPHGLHPGRVRVRATAAATVPAAISLQVPPVPALSSAGTGAGRSSPSAGHHAGGGAAGGDAGGGAQRTTSRSRPTAST